MEVVEADGLDLERAWRLASVDIVVAHNARSDLRAHEDRIGPRQRWALDLLRDLTVALPDGAEAAEEALTVGRGDAVRRALGEIEAELGNARITRDQSAQRIVEVVTRFGLQPVGPPPLPQPITADDLGVVCWMGVLPPRSSPGGDS